jgi:hypothetical protein
MAQLVLTDPAAFYSLIGQGTLQGALAQEAMIVSIRAGRVLPPPGHHNSFFGIVLDNEDRLESVSLIETSKLKVPLSWASLLVNFSFTPSYLSFRRVMELPGPVEVTVGKLRDFFTRTYFDPWSPEGPRLCDAFFLNDDNFAEVGCGCETLGTGRIQAADRMICIAEALGRSPDIALLQRIKASLGSRPQSPSTA